VQPADQLKSTTVRKVQSESNTGSVSSQRVKTTLTISVTSVEFDPTVGVLRVNGKNACQNLYVKMGQYHTLELELNRAFTLFKKEWDSIALDRIREASDITNVADVAAVVMHEGLANVCLITPNMTIVRQRIEMHIPKKRKAGSQDHDKALVKFYDVVYQSVLKHVNFAMVKVLILASPGFVKDHVYDHIFAEAVRTENKTLFEARSKFILVHSSSGHKAALLEILKDPSIRVKLADTKAAKEQRVLDTFFETLGADPDRAFYGWNHVYRAWERGAIRTLLVTDYLFRSADIPTRKKYVKLVERVKADKGEVYILSSQHVTGEQLGQLTGIAAILSFPLPGVATDEEDEREEQGEGIVKTTL